MYTSAKPYFYGTGRRKSSVARVRIMQGTGVITINGRSIDDYFGLETLKLIVRQPFEATKTLGTFDVICTVTGGGVSGQAGAIRQRRGDVHQGNRRFHRPARMDDALLPPHHQGDMIGSQIAGQPFGKQAMLAAVISMIGQNNDDSFLK